MDIFTTYLSHALRLDQCIMHHRYYVTTTTNEPLCVCLAIYIIIHSINVTVPAMVKHIV